MGRMKEEKRILASGLPQDWTLVILQDRISSLEYYTGWGLNRSNPGAKEKNLATDLHR